MVILSGGTIFTTKRSTLTKIKGSFFATTLSAPDFKLDEDDVYTILYSFL